jgi:hypothetical protein
VHVDEHREEELDAVLLRAVPQFLSRIGHQDPPAPGLPWWPTLLGTHL